MRSTKHLHTNGIFIMTLSCFFFGVMGVCAKYAMREADLFEAVFFRVAVCGLMIGSFIKLKKKSFLGKKPLLLATRGITGFIALNLIFYATAHIPLGDASMLSQTSPIFVVLFSVIFLKEKITRKGLILSLISLIGVAFIVKPSLAYHNLPALAGLGGGLMAAFAYISIRQLHATDSSFTMVFYFSALGTLFSFPLALSHFKLHSLPTMMALIGAGIAGTFGQLCMTYAYKLEEASVVSPISYLNVVFAFLFGILFFREIPDFYSVIGSVIVIGCCIGISKLRNSKHQKIVKSIDAIHAS